MEELLSQFQELYFIRALVASSMVGLMCGILGCFIVLRNMSLIGDALSHAILPGVVIAFMIVGHSAIGFFSGAVLAGLVAALLITWIQHNVKTKNDAAIGIVFTAMFALGVIGISRISRQGAGVHLDLKDFLFGNVLGVSDEDMYLTAAVTVYVILSVIVFFRYLFVTTFQPIIAQTMGISVKVIHYFLMLLLSFAVVASLQTVGVILVVAMLITPASTALLLSNRLNRVLIIAGLVGLFSAVIGIFISVLMNVPPGPAMAVVATLLYLIAVFFSPSKGLVFKFFQKRKLRLRIQLEDTLKQAFGLQQKEQLTLDKLLNQLGFDEAILKKHLSTLRQKGWMNEQNLLLTEKGKTEGQRLVRAHRLWETYLVDRIGLSAEQIHEDAEKYEHLLTDEILDEVDETLGYPSLDPHGSPIPAKQGLPDFPLIKLDILQNAQIAQQQINESISSKLWQLGLLPDMQFSLQQKEKEFVEILQNKREIKIPIDLARKVNVEK